MKKTGKTSAAVCALVLFSFALCVLCSAIAPVNLAKREQKTVYKNKESLMAQSPENTVFTVGDVSSSGGGYKLDLDGVWRMTNKGNISSLVSGKGWDGAINAEVPGSIYTALYKAGVIEDPYMSDNMKGANKYSEKNWYLMRSFEYNGSGKNVLLSFDGVCNVADFYLNGKKIGSHEGMFGGPYIDVTNEIKQGENTLVVHLLPAKDYTKTVVFNCSYGWHYAKLYPLGIWQSVSVSDQPDVVLDHPFITTYDSSKGTVDLAVTLDPANGKAFEGRLTVSVSPKNFSGKPAYFTKDVSGAGRTVLRYRADIPDPHLWWPNGYGEQNLYELTVTFEENGGGTSHSASQFGIRQLEYAPFPSGATNGTYFRQFVVNGVNVYMKGAGWCTIDAMMRFSRQDYDRILSRAHDAGINFFRAWGGGLVETDEFYDLCDEYGILVYQEWPCCWDSTKTQPADVLNETVVLNCKRLRNRASLAVWGGGNEGDAPYSDSVLNTMGKLTYETDGTRDFWRQDGGVGAANIRHDHIWWSGASPEYYIQTYTDIKNLNMHEYGLGAMMNRSSVVKFASDKELSEWPIGKRSSIAYHTATFDGYYGWQTTPYGHDIATHTHYASFFTDVTSLDELILGSQLSQAQADYPLAVNSRIKAPDNSANVIYKFNDNYPGASWSIVDWYGAPKIAYYLMQDAYRPVMAAFKTDKYNTAGAALSLPVYILDDTVSLKDKNTEVKVTAYDEKLSVIKAETYKGSVSSPVNAVGNFDLTEEQTNHTPLIITADLYVEGGFYDRTYMYFNYENDAGCLFYLPRTHIEYSLDGNALTVKNKGDVPAIGVNIKSTAEDSFVCSDSYFILTPGQSETVMINDASLFDGIDGFNVADANDKTPPAAPKDVTVSDIKSSSAKISWTASADDGDIYAYYVNLTDDTGAERTVFVHRNKTETVVDGLTDFTEYTVKVFSTDNNSNRSDDSAPVKFKTEPDGSTPFPESADMDGDGVITVKFSTAMDAKKASDPSHYVLNRGASVTEAVVSEDGMTVVLKTKDADASLSYTLGVIGLTDTKKSRNNTGYQQISVTRSLYLTLDFEPDENGAVYARGASEQKAEGINGEPKYTDNGTGGKALSASAGCGVMIKASDFSFKENSSVVLRIKGKASGGYNVLFAKGPKESGHFEFYTRDAELFIYAPDVGDIDLKYDINSGNTGWRTLAFVREENRLKVYEDGNEVGSVPFKGKIAEITNPVSVGSLNDGSLLFSGEIDSVQIYERALTPDEISGLYVEAPASADVFGFEENVITLDIGSEATLKPDPAYDGKYTLSAHGEAALLDGLTVKAVKPGETLIYAKTDDGEYVSAVLVTVKEPAPPQTEADTAPPQTDTESAPVPDDTKPLDADKKGPFPVIPVIASAAAVIAAAAAMIIIKKKKARSQLT